MGQHFGKHRGKVTNNVDPLGLGRIQVSVPCVLGEGRDSWAMPCVPYAGAGLGFYAIPPVKANVWVEFEGGDLDYPVWTGCFWGEGEAPVSSGKADVKVLKTEAGTITLDDTPGNNSITIETKADTKAKVVMRIVINRDGIEISNGRGASIVLQGPTVKLNDTALEVT
jgi:uncharacterized protein involved in type VI secretion and phage assembly